MNNAPPPPPPHGENPKSTGSGLPPGKYDIFIIPPHSSGSGFLYLPSLQPNVNSFVAGFASALILVVVGQALAPAVQVWWNSVKGSGGMGMILLMAAIGLGAWTLGRTQNDGTPRTGGGPNGGASDSGPYPNAHSQSNGYAGGAAPPPRSGPAPGPGAAGGARSGGGWQRTNPPPGATNANANADADTDADGGAKGAWERAREETKRKEEERKAREAAQKRKEELERKLREAREKEAREREARERRQRDDEARAKAKLQADLELEREKERARERERQKLQAERQKLHEEREREKQKLQEEREQERQKLQEERERERQKLQEERQKLQEEREQAAQNLKLEKEQAAQKLKLEKEQAEEKLKLDMEQAARKLKLEIEREAELARYREKEKAEEMEREKAKELQKEKDKERSRLWEAHKEKTKKLQLEREKAKQLEKEKEAAKPISSTYAFSATGEKTNPWPQGRPLSPTIPRSQPQPQQQPQAQPQPQPQPQAQPQPQPQPQSQPQSPTKRPPAPATKPFRGTEVKDEYSYRPYDKPKRPMHSKGPASLYSESSYGGSQSTSRTTPPPSMRGPYTTKDPNKIVIKAVYAFNNAFLKTPTSQLVSGVGSVTDGLILRITTEGLFIDDDVRGVPQREWDVKAWTMKLVEVWCPSFHQGPAGNSAFARASHTNPAKYKHNPVRRLWGMDKDKAATSEETDALLVDMLQLCNNNCRQRPMSSSSSVVSDDRSSVTDSAYGSSAASLSSSSNNKRTDKRGVNFQTGEMKSARLHVLRASLRDQEGKKYVFIVSEEESWKVSIGLQRLRKGTQVRALGVSGMSIADAKGTLEHLGWM